MRFAIALAYAALGFAEKACDDDGKHSTFMYSITGERYSRTDDFFLPDPKLSFYTNKLGYDAAAIDKLYADAETFFCTRFGIDFSEAALDPVMGTKNTGKWLLQPSIFNFNPRVNFAQGKGDYKDCPIPIDFGMLAAVSLDASNSFTGSFKPAGSLALVGDFVAYGNNAVDFEQDGTHSSFSFQSQVPVRKLDGETLFWFDTHSEEFGEGRMTGVVDFTADAAADSVLGAMRFVSNYPATWHDPFLDSGNPLIHIPPMIPATPPAPTDHNGPIFFFAG